MAVKKRSQKKSARKPARPARKAAKKRGKAAAAKASAKTRAAKKGKKKTARAARDDAPDSLLHEGSKAPAFSLDDQSGKNVSSRDLAGEPYVLYFYPKDDTSGCTIEACDFRDRAQPFKAAGVRVIGVSPDGVASHARFAGKFGLQFSLLADEQRKLANDYGVWVLKKNYGKEYMGILRSTFLVDGRGVVRRAWRGIRAQDHAAAVLAEAQRLA